MNIFDVIGPSGEFTTTVVWLWVGFCALGFLVAGIAGAILLIMHANKKKKQNQEKDSSKK
jgi:uncharacterized membrane protein YuzA (DUF378 family)